MINFRKFFHKIKLFGFRVVFWRILYILNNKIKIFTSTIVPKKHNAILDWLYKKYGYFIETYKKQNIYTTPSQISIPKQIWLCWWDGIDTMPPIVKACYNSVLRNANGFKVTVITKDNFTEYISVPDHILEKVKKKIITLTHFSNIIRMSLLDKYGGLWLDATVLVTGTINFGDISFFTVKRNLGTRLVPQRRWAGNCIGGVPKTYLFNFIREFLCEYWKEQNERIDYLLYDYSIALAYNSFPEIKEMIDNVPMNNKNYMTLKDHLKEKYNPDIFNEITQDTIFHKLTWKKDYSHYDKNNKLTFYGYIIQTYME